MHEFHLEADTVILEQARTLLMALYKARRNRLGRPLEASEFYPVGLHEIIESVLSWGITEETFPPGTELQGACDYDRKTIRISRSLSTVGERNYTLAHEIGHAVLHTTAEGCNGIAPRISSVRRVKAHNYSPKALKREREAELFAEELLMPPKAVAEHFEALFHRSRIWTESRALSELLPSARRDSNRRASVLDVARRLATHSPHAGRLALTEFFGVSAEAMAIRLQKLALVY